MSQSINLANIKTCSFNGADIKTINLNGQEIWTGSTINWASTPNASWTLQWDSSQHGGDNWNHSIGQVYQNTVFNFKGNASTADTKILANGTAVRNGTNKSLVNEILVPITNRSACNFPTATFMSLYADVARGRWSPPERDSAAVEYSDTHNLNVFVQLSDGRESSVVQSMTGAYGSSVWPTWIPLLFGLSNGSIPSPTTVLNDMFWNNHARVFTKLTSK